VRWKSPAILLAAILLVITAAAQQPANPDLTYSGSALPAVQPPGRPGYRQWRWRAAAPWALAHIGVLQWLEEHHSPDRPPRRHQHGRARRRALRHRHLRPPRCAPSPSAMPSPASSPCKLPMPPCQLPPPPGPPRTSRRALTVGLRPRPAVPTQCPAYRSRRQRVPGHVNLSAMTTAGSLDFDRLPIPFRCVATDLNSPHLGHPSTSGPLASGRARLHLHSLASSRRFKGRQRPLPGRRRHPGQPAHRRRPPA
jgi:hypothetical protein